ncbi:MAG: hypothetical protein Kow0042_14950 [Calditrichia bacterium]
MSWAMRMLLIISPVVFVCQLYEGWRIANSLASLLSIHKIKILIFLSLFILSVNFLPLLIIFYHGAGMMDKFFLFNRNLTWYGVLITFSYWWALVVAIEALPYFLSLDIFRIIFRTFSKMKYAAFKPYFHWIRLVIILFLIMFSGYKIMMNTYFVKRNHHVIHLNNLPPEMSGLTITLLSDIQVDRYTQRFKLNATKNRIEEIQSDLVIFTGDLVTHGEYYIQTGLNLLCDITPQASKFACLGDHDFWSNPVKIADGLKNCGWTFLENQHHLTDYRNHTILVTGLTQIYSRRLSPADLESILSSAPPADLKILMVHQPSHHIIQAAQKYKYDLLLAGHTHGGQVVFHPFGFPLTPSQFENQFFSGHHTVGSLNIIVTNGVGLTLAPIRYGAQAEISTITLQSAK